MAAITSQVTKLIKYQKGRKTKQIANQHCKKKSFISRQKIVSSMPRIDTKDSH